MADGSCPHPANSLILQILIQTICGNPHQYAQPATTSMQAKKDRKYLEPF